MGLWNREPALILAVIQAGLALALGFGVHLTTEQMALIMAFVAALLGLITRSRVSSASIQSAARAPGAE